MATIEEILANVNARGYDSNQNTANTNFGIGSSRGANQNYANLYNVKPPIQNTPVENTLMNYNEHYNMPPQQNTGGIIDFFKTQGSKLKDFALPAFKNIAGRTIASQGLGKAGFMIGGLPGYLAGTIFGGLKGGDLFNQPYIGGVTTVDQFGNLISGEELDKQNALGGYYSDAARASRSRDNRIAKMRERQVLGKRISENNLAALEKLQAEEETARQAEADAMQAANKAANTGGYQAGYSDDFMTGGDSQRDDAQEASSPGSSGPGGSDTMGSFRYGGIVGMYR